MNTDPSTIYGGAVEIINEKGYGFIPVVVVATDMLEASNIAKRKVKEAHPNIIINEAYLVEYPYLINHVDYRFQV